MKYMMRNGIPARTPPGLPRSALSPKAQAGSVKFGYGSGEGWERRPCFINCWLSECDNDEGEGWRGCRYGCQKALGFLLSSGDWMERRGARKLGEYKFFWMGCSKGIHGVGMLVADRWIEKVVEVRRVSERLWW